ncbi:MAG: hypothetical protein LBC27_01315 [Spirochaetaceae bacterium]|jgi:hypothetical protein|nr:hypothetical protein [Spirochaetaceae bacterium]
MFVPIILGHYPPPPHLFSLTPGTANFHNIHVQCIDHWSVRNYGVVSETLPPDEFFFDTFEIFGSAGSGTENSITLFKELREHDANPKTCRILR